MKKSILTLVAVIFTSSTMFAQLRATDQTGINVFETPKTDVPFTGPKVDLGASISMPYMALVNTNSVTNQDPTKNTQALFKNSPNFA